MGYDRYGFRVKANHGWINVIKDDSIYKTTWLLSHERRAFAYHLLRSVIHSLARRSLRGRLHRERDGHLSHQQLKHLQRLRLL